MLDLLLTVFFTIELLFRAIVAPGFCHLPDNLEHIPANYKLTPFFHDTLIYFDIISVLPTYLEFLLLAEANSIASYGTIASIVNAFKVLRVFRIFKTLRSFSGTKVIAQTCRGSCRPLCDSLIPIVLLIFLFGGSILVAIIPCNGLVGTEACEIADLWSGGYFIIITITSVGYGDMVPHGIFDRLLVILLMMSGALLLAIPLAIIGNKFADAFDKKIAGKKRRNIGKFGLRAPLVDMESDSVRQQRLLNTSMLLYARILGVERRLMDNMETSNQGMHDVATLNALHQEIAQDTVAQMPIIDRHSRSIGNLGRQLTNKVTVTPATIRSISKVQPASNKVHTRKRRQLPSSLGSFRVKDLVNCCSRSPARRMIAPRDSAPHRREIEELRSEARVSRSCRDKLWLALHHPRENKPAFMLYLGRSLVVMVAILVCSLQTLQQLNFYGSDTVLCSGVVDQYCANIASLDKDWRLSTTYAMNFAEYEHITRDDIIRFNNFCFPHVCDYNQTSATHNCTEPSDVGAYEPEMSCLTPDPKSTNLTKCGLALAKDVSLADFCGYRNVSVENRRYRLDASAIAQDIVSGDVPVCQRLACQDNSADRSLVDSVGETRTYSIIAGIELVFTTLFLVDFSLRLVTMRPPKR